MNFNEKYRVASLNQIKGQDYIVSKLEALVDNIHNTIDDGDMPHLFFTGPAGTGKTACAIALQLDAFGPNWRDNYREYNASETKIDKIRTEVIDFANKATLGDYKHNGEIYEIPFSVIFFDEIDYLPPKSQAILRRIMEKHAVNTRFVLSCNYEYKVIDALKSRCMCFHFRRLSPNAIKEMLQPIIKKEAIKIDGDALNFLSKWCNGDARKAQNGIQKAALTGSIDLDEIKRATENIYNFTKDGKEIEKFNTKILELAIVANGENDENYTKDYKILESQLNKLYYDRGQTGSQILMNIFDSVVNDEEMPIPVKRKLFASIGDCMRDCSLVGDDIYAVKMWLRGLK